MDVSSDTEKESLGVSPAVLAKRYLVKPNPWCSKLDLEFDVYCDAANPKLISYKSITKAASEIKSVIAKTPLRKSKCCVQFNMELHYKFELFHQTGSFHERSALYSLKMLDERQRAAGVITASLGNWAQALAYYGKRLGIPVIVVLPVHTMPDITKKCEDFGAQVILRGNDFGEAKRQAFQIISNGKNCSYINGYDHPNVIAGAGTIGLEILEQLPGTQVILVPVGGGGLIAGIATAVKQLRPEILIYGIQSDKCGSFYKAMENNRPINTSVYHGLAESLAIPLVGYNAFHSAHHLVDKMVLVNDDSLTRAILHLAEEEKVITEGAGAISVAALLAAPNILPELQNKTVVCVITGGNINHIILTRCLDRAKAIEGRLIKITIKLATEDSKGHAKILRIIASMSCNILQSYRESGWLIEDRFYTTYLILICETRGIQHACSVKRVLNTLFPDLCQFEEEPFNPVEACCCFPKRFP
ncbi:L-threonine dehydratase catabolic TdcB [Manduca sexta]|uniref:L-threonine dehydratase catabolic TdcB n=1 Tax=Manduca sexta TaxID=7130 RepID=UPI00188F854E|nr:L-threonine dehydratase catabolic TdcB [Manduca sexta]